MSVYFISGIDTDIGKTIAAGVLAKALYRSGCHVITQKLVQTGCEGIAEDIVTHREIMGLPLQPVDKEGTTCPYVFRKPASPHLSSALADTVIKPDLITAATMKLAAEYDVVLLEGAGGLMVPITKSLSTLDYIANQHYPIILVTSGRLGSINHTVLSIEAIQARGLRLDAVFFNNWHPDKHLYSQYKQDHTIMDSTKAYLQCYLKQNCPEAVWVDMIDDAIIYNEKTTYNQYAIANYAQYLIG